MDDSKATAWLVPREFYIPWLLLPGAIPEFQNRSDRHLAVQYFLILCWSCQLPRDCQDLWWNLSGYSERPMGLRRKSRWCDILQKFPSTFVPGHNRKRNFWRLLRMKLISSWVRFSVEEGKRLWWRSWWLVISSCFLVSRGFLIFVILKKLWAV